MPARGVEELPWVACPRPRRALRRATRGAAGEKSAQRRMGPSRMNSRNANAVPKYIRPGRRGRNASAAVGVSSKWSGRKRPLSGRTDEDFAGCPERQNGCRTETGPTSAGDEDWEQGNRCKQNDALLHTMDADWNPGESANGKRGIVPAKGMLLSVHQENSRSIRRRGVLGPMTQFTLHCGPLLDCGTPTAVPEQLTSPLPRRTESSATAGGHPRRRNTCPPSSLRVFPSKQHGFAKVRGRKGRCVPTDRSSWSRRQAPRTPLSYESGNDVLREATPSGPRGALRGSLCRVRQERSWTGPRGALHLNPQLRRARLFRDDGDGPARASCRCRREAPGGLAGGRSRGHLRCLRQLSQPRRRRAALHALRDRFPPRLRRVRCAPVPPRVEAAEHGVCHLQRRGTAPASAHQGALGAYRETCER